MTDPVADQLYRSPPAGFVAARDKAVAAARAAGDTGRARELAALRRPTVAAWLVNLLALDRPEVLADLAGFAGELRAAQRTLRGDRLRELSGQRRAVIAALVAQARELAVAQAPELARGKLPLAEVETTLGAALAADEAATQVRSGRLVRMVAYAGFGEVPRPQLRLVTATGGAAATEEAAAPAADEAVVTPKRSADARRALRRELATAQVEVGRAERALASARRRAQQIEARLATHGEVSD
jgi:hypothetical protein